MQQSRVQLVYNARSQPIAANSRQATKRIANLVDNLLEKLGALNVTVINQQIKAFLFTLVNQDRRRIAVSLKYVFFDKRQS